MNITKGRITWLKDKLQSWPGEMALTAEDIADLIALIESGGKQESPDEMKDYYDFSNGRRGPVVVDRPDKMIAKPAPDADERMLLILGDVAKSFREVHDWAWKGKHYIPVNKKTVIRRKIASFLNPNMPEWVDSAFAHLRSCLSQPALPVVKDSLTTDEPVNEEVSCSHCGGSGYARGGEEEQIKCRTCSGSGIVLGQARPAPPVMREPAPPAELVRRANEAVNYEDMQGEYHGISEPEKPAPPTEEPEKIDTQDLLDKGILLTHRPAAPVRVTREWVDKLIEKIIARRPWWDIRDTLYEKGVIVEPDGEKT